MGMDVYGKKPKSETGEYFRNNVWWWHPLWDYCVAKHGDIIGPDVADSGHYNSGAGLNATRSRELGEALLADIEAGITAQWKIDRDMEIAQIPRETCFVCHGSGIRDDELGKSDGQDVKELEPELAILLGRTNGWCNGCNGEGLRDSWASHYPFEVSNVREFAEFLVDSGGFEIC
jgi:hypothetical protein